MFLQALDELDQKIIRLLIENARISYSDIGQQVGISRVAVKAVSYTHLFVSIKYNTNLQFRHIFYTR